MKMLTVGTLALGSVPDRASGISSWPRVFRGREGCYVNRRRSQRSIGLTTHGRWGFFITADYAFGHDREKRARDEAIAEGGKLPSWIG
jgi:hypothetical protein